MLYGFFKNCIQCTKFTFSSTISVLSIVVTIMACDRSRGALKNIRNGGGGAPVTRAGKILSFERKFLNFYIFEVYRFLAFGVSNVQRRHLSRSLVFYKPKLKVKYYDQNIKLNMI